MSTWIDLIPRKFIELYDLELKVKYDSKGVHLGYAYINTGTTSPHIRLGPSTHKTRPVRFSLVVKDFRIKYIGKESAKHLINALKDFYDVEVDWNGALYCGMPNYVQKQLLRYYKYEPARR